MTDSRAALAAPLDPPPCPTAELVASTRREEARTAMATVAALLDAGVPVRDVVVTARDLDPYEEPLARAAVRYGVTPVFWTQLRVTRTRPYALVTATCDALSGSALSPDDLLAPLAHRWAPRDATDEWPIAPAELDGLRSRLPDDARSVEEWRTTVADDPLDPRLTTYLDWVAEHATREPSPEAVGRALRAVVTGYREAGLPETQRRDGPALLDTEREARAVRRVDTLVEQVRHKYEEWLADGVLDPTWDEVRELCELLATQRPGHREHSNATAVDVMEGNDLWALDVPYVVAVGLVDGEWPSRTGGEVPAELAETVLAGGETAAVAPWTAHAEGRDRDHFGDATRAAGRGVVVTRHTETPAGDERHPSPYLDWLDADRVSEAERRALTSPENALPDAIQGMLPEPVEARSEVVADE